MRIRIVHETGYKFSSAVFLEPHYFRFNPKNKHYNNLESFGIIISPEPAGLSEQHDQEDNSSQFCWFDGLHSHLKIRSESIVTTCKHNPFNFLVYTPAAAALPFSYPMDLKELLNPLLQHSGISDTLSGYAEILKKSSGGRSI